MKKKSEKSNCKKEPKVSVISKCVFDKEIKLCQKLSKENNDKCNWGKCKDCGAIPLLYKLYKGKLLEERREIEEIKKRLLKLSL